MSKIRTERNPLTLARHLRPETDGKPSAWVFARLRQSVIGFARRVHGDERGVLTLTSVFALFLFTILLIMIVNVATHLDDKINRQNAADAATYSGGVVLARGMNTISYTNHLLMDVFAVTAFLREGRNRQSEQLVPEILDEWELVGHMFQAAEFQKFRDLGEAIVDRSARQPLGKDRRLVQSFGNMTAAAADYALPVFEYILRGQGDAPGPEGGLIPQFQRQVLRMIPHLAQQVTHDMAWRHGLANRDLNNLPGPPRNEQNGRGPQSAMLWRLSVEAVGDPNEDAPLVRSLPIVDPSPTGNDLGCLPNAKQIVPLAQFQRQEFAKHYLELWTRDKLQLFESKAQMSRFSHLWRIFTCAELDRLLNIEYPTTNLPMMLRHTDLDGDWETLRRSGNIADINRNLERDFQFLGVVYREHRPESGPGLFKNPLAKHADALTFTQISLFVPRPRRYLSAGGGQPRTSLGGTFGFASNVPLPPPPATGPIAPEQERWPAENWPTHWDLYNQNWSVKLVPATAETIPEILQTPPRIQSVRTPNLGPIRIEQLNRVNTH